MSKKKLQDKVDSLWCVLKINCKYIFKNTFKTAATLYTVATIILAFIPWDALGITTLVHRFLSLVLVLLLSFILAIVYTLWIKKSRTLWMHGNGSIHLCYIDILKIAFAKHNNSKRIIVIPVNNCFDTVVDSNLSTQDRPLVSEKSLHGKWITKMLERGYSQEQLNNKIKFSLDLNHIVPYRSKKRDPGNSDFYPLGSTSIVAYDENVTFFLHALAEFDDYNVAHCSLEEYLACLSALVDCYIKHGQGYDFYIPLMGTNLSRAGLSHKDALEKIVSMIKLRNAQLQGKITIAIFPSDKEKVTILDI